MTSTTSRSTISRRAFLAATGAGATALLALPRSLRAQGAPTLRIAVSGLTGEVFDPMMEVRGQVSDVNYIMFDSIFEIGPNNELVPGLAEEWSVDDAGTTWTFKLRKGVQFHGGYGELTAEDVVYSLQRWMHPDVASASAPPLRGAVESVAVIDPYTFELRTKTPRPSLPYLLSPHESVAGIVLSKKHLMEAGDDFAAQTKLLNEKPIGSGIYQFESHMRGQSLTLTAVDNHWRGNPDIRRVEFLIVPDASTQFLMLQSGEIDMMKLDPDQASQVEGMDGIALHNVANAVDYGINLYGTYTDAGKAAPAGDVRVRRAISLAINRQAINDALLGGRGKLPSAPWSLAASADGYVADELKDWLAEVSRYDPEEAKKLLAEAGFPDGFTIAMRHSTRLTQFPNTNDAALAVAAQLGEVGIKVDFTTQEYTTLRPYLVEKQADPYIASQLQPVFTSGYFTAETWLRVYFSQRGTSKLGNDPRIEEALDGVAKSQDKADREKSAMVGIRAIAESWVSIPVLSADTLFAVSEKVVSKWHERANWPFLSRQIELLKAAG